MLLNNVFMNVRGKNMSRFRGVVEIGGIRIVKKFCVHDRAVVLRAGVNEISALSFVV